MDEKRFLQYRTFGGEVVHEVEVSGRSERSVEQIMAGMLRNMREDLYVHDTGLAESGRPDSVA